MNRDLATAAVVSGALHFGALLAFAIQARPVLSTAAPAAEDVAWLESNLAEPRDVEPLPEESLHRTGASESEAMETPVASLPEPPRTLSMDAVLDRIVVRPPEPPHPNGLRGFASVPTGRDGKAAVPELTDVLSIEQLDRPPQLRFRPSPVYPFDLRRSGITGSAEIWMRVSEEGTVVEARIFRATHAEFGRAALEAVRRFRFSPGTRAGRPVQFALIQPIPFTLTNDTDR